MFYWGVRRLPFARFAFLDLIGCFLSVLVLGLLGFGLSESAVTVFGRVQRAERWIAMAVLVGAGVILGVRALGRRVARAR